MMEVQMPGSASSLPKLEKLTTKAIKLGLDQGASQIEVKLSHGHERSIQIEGNSISGVQQQSKTKIVTRVYIGKKMGIASATSLTMASIEDVVLNSLKLAQFSPEDPNFESLAGSLDREPVPVTGLYDPALVNLDPSTVVENVNDLIQGAVEVDDRAKVSGKLNLNATERIVANSLGISTPTSATSMMAYSYISVPNTRTDIGLGMEFHASRSWDSDLDFFDLGKVGAEKAVKMLGAQAAPSKKMSIILDERAAYSLLSNRIGIGVNGYLVMTGMSYFTDKIGEELGVANLNIWDDPHVDGGLNSRSHDGEGVPTTRVDLIENGVLSNYVTDSYTSNNLGLVNTGNARSSFGGRAPRPTIHQMQIAGAEDSKDAMIEDMREGIVVEDRLSVRAISPDISSKLDRAFYVKDGEIQFPLKDTMMGTDVFELLKSIDGISKEVRIEFGHQAPMISIEKVSIAGTGDIKNNKPSITMSTI